MSADVMWVITGVMSTDLLLRERSEMAGGNIEKESMLDKIMRKLGVLYTLDYFIIEFLSETTYRIQKAGDNYAYIVMRLVNPSIRFSSVTDGRWNVACIN